MSGILVVTSVEKEARAIPQRDDVVVVVSGIGRANAAATTTEAIIKRGPFDAVICAGVAGALPGSELSIGDTVVASSCVYVEEGVVTAGGFAPLSSIGLSLGDFQGNIVPVDGRLLEQLSKHFPIGPIATVATCSGTDASAAEVVRRTDAVAEAMEGAAVVHAARRLNVPAIELRTVSNTTGDRAGQRWNLDAAIAALSTSMSGLLELLR